MTLNFLHITKSLVALTLLTLSVFSYAGGSLDLSLSDTSARIGWDATKVSSGLHLNAALLHEKDEGNMANLGLHVVDIRKQKSHLYIGIGGNAYVFNNDDTNGGAVGVGGFFRYKLPVNPDFSLYGYAYYAPPVVSFSEIENLIDADIRIQYDVLTSAHVYLGVRGTSIQFEGQDDRYSLADGAHIGLRLDF